MQIHRFSRICIYWLKFNTSDGTICRKVKLSKVNSAIMHPSHGQSVFLQENLSDKTLKASVPPNVQKNNMRRMSLQTCALCL